MWDKPELRCDDLNAAIWRNASENSLFFSKTLPRRSKAQSGAWRNGTWLGLTDLEALLTVAREAHSAQQVTQAAGAEVDREKLLKEPGVYATFAVFKVGDQWSQMEKEARASSVADVKKVFEKHAEKVAVDTYLLRGLSERADFFLRVYSKEMLDNQNFLVDFMGTTFGKGLKNTDTFNGLTKALNYVPKVPGDLKA
ncbi:MAG: chlorite dismutase family protein [Nitrospirales bacterium]